MNIHSLGYVALRSTDLGAWRAFATEVLGLMCGARDDHEALWLRLDERCQRIVVTQAEEDGFDAAGWEVRNDIELERAVAILEEQGIAYKHEPGLAELRGVADLVRFEDPSGNPAELFWGMQQAAEAFASPAGVQGFVTGDAGLGHVVLSAEHFAETDRFYRRGLGFGLTDFADMGGMRGHFLHTNRRHHSLALISAPRDAWFVRGGLVHLMLQVQQVTDVGRALARATAAGLPFFETLGQHANDRMTSFYVISPGGFPIEFGADAIDIDPNTWSTTNCTVPDVWGHEVLGFPEE